MSAASQAVELFAAGVPVREIGEIVGLERTALTEVLTRYGQRPPRSCTTVTRIMRVCPFFESCRDCTFQGCAMDKFREVTM